MACSPFGLQGQSPLAAPWAQPLPLATAAQQRRPGRIGGSAPQRRGGQRKGVVPSELPTAQPLGISPQLPLMASIDCVARSPPPALASSGPLSTGLFPLPQAHPAAPGSLPIGAPLAKATVLGGVARSAPHPGALPFASVSLLDEASADDPSRDRDRRHRARVSRVGAQPALTIEGLGEFAFAYRAVKKKPGEPRTLLAIGDLVECRLTKAVPPKAVSVRILQGTGVPLSQATAEELNGVARSGESGTTQGLTPHHSPADSSPDDAYGAPPDLEDDSSSEEDEESNDVIPLCGATHADPLQDIPVCGAHVEDKGEPAWLGTLLE